MRYRKLDANGDMVFGHGSADFLVNSPATVTQAVETALRLLQGEWFYDLTAGVPWLQQVIGRNTVFDQVIKSAILSVNGVVSLGDNYQSSLNDSTRELSVNDDGIVTIFGTGSLNINMPPDSFVGG